MIELTGILKMSVKYTVPCLLNYKAMPKVQNSARYMYSKQIIMFLECTPLHWITYKVQCK